MVNLITDNIDIWTTAQTTKTNGRGRSPDNQSLHGIKKLRELILELAVRGKLVPQDLNDEPAIVLLERIAKERKHLFEEGKTNKQKPLSEISQDETPFELPEGWEWVRFQDISAYIQRGKGPQYADEGKVRVISQKCIQWSGFDLSQARFVEDDSIDVYQPERFLEQADLLWNSTGTGTVGRINVLREVKPNTLVADSHVTVIRPMQIDSSFLWCYVAAPGIQLRIEPGHDNSLVSGTTNQVELNTTAVQSLLVPIPPLAEQHRIVAKVNELMALCDQLEQQQTDSNAAHQALVETLLTTLTDAADQSELETAWHRIANHFDSLFTTEHSIDQLKQTILQLAVMGKLVPQDSNDEMAHQLLTRIEAAKQQLLREGKSKAFKPQRKIVVDEVPYKLPKGWEWTRLGSIATFENGDRSSRYPNESDLQPAGVPFFGAKDMVDGILRFDSGLRFISESKFDELSNGKLIDKDFVILLRGAVGKMAVFRANSEFSTGFINAQMGSVK